MEIKCVWHESCWLSPLFIFLQIYKKLSAILQVYFSLLSEDWKIATLDSFQLSLYWCYIINSPPTFSFPYQVIPTFYSFLQNVFIFKIQIISPYSLDAIWFLYELVKMPICWAFLYYRLQGPGKQPHLFNMFLDSLAEAGAGAVNGSNCSH